jgi:hypothetical protein
VHDENIHQMDSGNKKQYQEFSCPEKDDANIRSLKFYYPKATQRALRWATFR